MEKIRMAVIGIGTMGKKYAKMIQEEGFPGCVLGQSAAGAMKAVSGQKRSLARASCLSGHREVV